ncbi:hypothetical protein M426DRAFT_267706 [Hypoxylon sp. CI-4A]|nr:hypothetical protein M426DRAFT_267706 [Hypoxylon sp. CI-4A]
MAIKTEESAEKLPAVPSEVTAKWLGSKLGHSIRSVSLTECKLGTGGTLFFSIEYADETPDAASRPMHVCVKGIFDPTTHTKIAPSIKHISLLKGLWAGKSDRQGITIMSDLSDQGCTFPPEVGSYPLEKVLEGAAQLAGLHAQFWGVNEEKYSWMPNRYDAPLMAITEQWDSIVREPGRPKLPEHLLNGARVRKAQEKYYATHNPKFRTFLHGDTHMGNIYFTREGHTLFLDWSVSHFASCFHDLVYFLSTTLTIEDRRAHEMEVLDHYLATLHLLDGPKFDRNDEDVMIECKRSYMTNIIWLVCGYDLQTKERVDALAERTIAAWVDHKLIEVIEAQ